MEWGWAGRRLIMAPGTTIHFLGGVLSAGSRGAGYRTTTVDGCSGRVWDGFGAPLALAAEAALVAGDR